VLDVRGLVVRYGVFLALHGIDLEVQPGEIVGVIGLNGAGKSSLVRAIAGVTAQAAGSIRLRGVELRGEPHERMERGISIVPEGRGLFVRMSIEENLLMGGYRLRQASRVRRNMERCYAMFPVLRERRRQMAGTLSGGEQQMLAISTGLMSDPEILILDEPSLGLAPIVIGDIGRSLLALKADGLTVLLVEQNATLTCDVADRIYVLQNGVVTFHDTPANLFADPAVAESFLSVA
jgi:branched-chain amino acid transport system ATP-binding protein